MGGVRHGGSQGRCLGCQLSAGRQQQQHVHPWRDDTGSVDCLVRSRLLGGGSIFKCDQPTADVHWPVAKGNDIIIIIIIIIISSSLASPSIVAHHLVIVSSSFVVIVIINSMNRLMEIAEDGGGREK